MNWFSRRSVKNPREQQAMSEVCLENITGLRAAAEQIRSHRRKVVRVWSEFLLCAYMLACWRISAITSWNIGKTVIAFAGLALFETLLRKSAERLQPSARSVAKQIERIDPALAGRLLTAVEQVGDESGFSYLQSRLFGEIAVRGKNSAWIRVVSPLQTRLWTLGLRCAQLSSLLACILFVSDRKGVVPSTGPGEPVATVAALTPVVLPGNTEVEKGTRLTVSARLKDLSPEVQLRFRGITSGSEMVGKISMAQALGEPLYGASLESVESDLEYWIETPFGESEHFVVTVFEFPKLERSDALVRFPVGVEPAERRYENSRKLTVPEGSSVQWELQFNKPLKIVRLAHKGGRVEELSVSENGATALWRLEGMVAPVDAVLEISDAQGRAACEQLGFQIQVVPNAPAKIRAVMPRGDARFTMVEEVDFEAEAWDDSSLLRWGMGIQIGSGAMEEYVLGTRAKGGEKVRMHRLEFLEERGVRVGDSVSWFFWAEDLDGAGKPRRTDGDLMLGRIRAFEEEYRQDDSEEESKGSGGPQLLELQKQVMAATWNVKRKSGSAAKPDVEALKNLGVVRASEAKVLELTQEKAADEGDEIRRSFYREAISELEKAVKELAASESDAAHIAYAVRAERSAYDALTHVVPSSYMMKKSRNPNAGEMEEKTRQMSNLDFAKQEDRYQSKSEATGEKEREERSQTEELLAQLRALARRQEEVIDRMRELESRVRNSVDEKEREAAKRELKKLSDEQKALARELENTQQKAEEKSESLARQSEGLDAAREAAQRAASALEKGALDEARASAARSSEKLRAGGEALRQQLSGRTREAARELQQRAQELVSQEQSIAEALNNQRKGPSRLSEGGLPKDLESQRKRLKELQEEIQRAAEATEVSEPLFSKALQDVHRSSVQNQTELKFKVVEEALASRRQDVARRAEKSAAQDVQDLAQTVEKAADEVLGDDAQALRQARAAVDKIARELSEKAGLAMNGRQRAADPDQAPAPERTAVPGSKDGKNGKDGAESNQSGSGNRSKAAKAADAGGKTGGERPSVDGPTGRENGRVTQVSSMESGGGNPKGGGYAGGGGVPVQDLGDWLNQLDRVEALLEGPQLRAGVARVQQAAEQLRGDMKRNASKPSPEHIQQNLLAPLTELRDAISSELARREGRENDTPIDRDPVPRKYEASVRRYYEALGGGK